MPDRTLPRFCSTLVFTLNTPRQQIGMFPIGQRFLFFIGTLFHFKFISFVCAAVSAGRGAFGLHLREAAIHKQFRSCHEACVIGGEKHDGLGDLIGCAQPAEGDIVRDILQALLARF
jgi:hypothetical protein